jgi:ADP-heptose:LPS heptosyltransferase
VAVALLFGPEDAAAARSIEARLPAGSLLLRGEPLGVVSALLARARCFIGHDSGPSHLSAAAGIPGVVVYPDGPGWERHLAKWVPPGGTVEPVPRSGVSAEALLSRVIPRLEGRA